MDTTLRLLWGWSFVALVLVAMGAGLRAFYCAARWFQRDEPDFRLWKNRYYKAMGTLLVAWLLGALLWWIKVMQRVKQAMANLERALMPRRPSPSERGRRRRARGL